MLHNNMKTKICSLLSRALRPVICFIGKLSYLAGGMAITVRGRQVSREEAPILVVAPHSSFLDSCIVYATKMSSVIVRKESMDNYVGSRFSWFWRCLVCIWSFKQVVVIIRRGHKVLVIFWDMSKCEILDWSVTFHVATKILLAVPKYDLTFL